MFFAAYFISSRGSDYYVGMAQVQNGGLYIGYRSARPKAVTEAYLTHTDERSSLFKYKTTLEVSLTFVGVEQLNRKNIDFVLLLSIFYLLLLSSSRPALATKLRNIHDHNIYQSESLEP